MNFSSCQNYLGGGGQNDMFPPPPHIVHILFLSVHLGVLPPQYQKAGYASDMNYILPYYVEQLNRLLKNIVFV